MDRVPIPQDFPEKNNLVIKENSSILEILQKHAKLFRNYVLVSKNLHIGPCINFYIYNYVLFLINSVYFISYLTY
jgi:hypothetical protein